MKYYFVAGYNEVSVNDNNGNPILKKGIYYKPKDVLCNDELLIQWNKINDLIIQAFDPKNKDKKTEMIDYICLFYSSSIKTNYPWLLKYANDIVRSFVKTGDNEEKKVTL